MISSYRRFLIFALVLMLVACTTSPQRGAVVNSGNAESTTDSVTFVHLNDAYRIDDVKAENSDILRVGGLGRVATVVEQLQSHGQRVEILHAGDFLFPSLESEEFDGLKMIEALNYLHRMAPLTAVPGNHEFDKVKAIFEPAVSQSEFTWLGNNLRFITQNAAVDQRLQDTYWIDLNGNKIGVFGLTLWEQDLSEHRGQDKYVDVDPDYIGRAEQAIQRLRGQGAKAIIGLTHLKFSDDLAVAGLKAKYPELIWLATAHEHTSAYRPGSSGQALITRAAANARTVWQVTVAFDAAGAPTVTEQEVAMDDRVRWHVGYDLDIANPTRLDLLRKLPFLEHVIGRAAVDLDGREENIRGRETAWGTYITDEMKTMFPGTEPDLAFLHGGTIRIDDIISGDITVEDLWRTFGFDTPLRFIELKAADLREYAFAHGLSSDEPAPGRYLQFSSGVRICFNPRDKTVPQLQLLDADQGWRTVADDELLQVVVPDYIFRGGDDYQFGQKAISASPASGDAKYLILGSILKATADGKAIGKAVDPNNPRIVPLAEGQERCFN